jgi:calcineurin-like phosphoesterase family protein
MDDELPRWVTSDTHFLLDDLRYRPPDADARMCASWRALVSPVDTVLHLGDVGGWEVTGLERLLQSLPGHVILIPGNWEEGATLEACRGAGWTVRAPFNLQYRGWVIEFTHEPVEVRSPGLVNVHGHHHPPGSAAGEPSRYHLNVAAGLHGWKPMPLASLVDKRIRALDPGRT